MAPGYGEPLVGGVMNVGAHPLVVAVALGLLSPQVLEVSDDDAPQLCQGEGSVDGVSAVKTPEDAEPCDGATTPPVAPKAR